MLSFSSYPEYLSNLYCVGLVPLVEFAQRFQPDAVELCNVEEALIGFNDVNRVFLELLRCAFALILQVDEVTFCRGVVARQVVVLVEFMQAQARLLTDGRHIIANLDDDEMVLVVQVYLVTLPELINRIRLCGSSGRLLRAVLACVELLQVVHLDDTNERFCVGRIGGITRRFQSSSPAFVVSSPKLIESLIAFLLSEL